MSTGRDVLKFGAAAAVAGLVATEFEWEAGTVQRPVGSSPCLAPENVILPEAFATGVAVTIGGRRQLVRPLSFFATLPAPFDADIYVWGYHVRPAVVGANSLAVSVAAPTRDSEAARGGDRTSLTPILRQCITLDEGMYRALPDDRPVPPISPAKGRMTRDGAQTIARPMVRLANPIPGAPAGGMTPEVARQIVLAEVERGAGPVQSILVNNTRWEGLQEKRSTPAEIWESCNLMEAAEYIHFVEFQFVGRHGLDADAFRALHDSLFPGTPYPRAISDTGVVARRGADSRAGVHASGPGPGRPVDESYVLPSPMPFGNAAAGAWLQGFPPQSASESAGREEDIPDWDDTLPVGLSGLDPADGPGYAWHCHIVSREAGAIGCL